MERCIKKLRVEMLFGKKTGVLWKTEQRVKGEEKVKKHEEG